LVRHHRLRWPELKLDDDLLLGELAFIDESLLGSEEDYLSANRAGRGFALRAGERSEVWALHKAVAAALDKRGQMAWSALPAAIARASRHHAALERREHILVDEAQFFAPAWFAVVKLSLAPRGQLFLCADPKQGFMRHRLSWKSAGLDVAGRTKKLSRSYRTTRTLLESASAMVDSLLPDESGDEVQPDYAGMETGVRPMLLYTASPQDALDRLVNEIDALSGEGLPLDAFLVVFGDNVNRRALYAQLVRRLGERRVWQLNEGAQKKAPPGVNGADCLRVAYLDTATGLEGIVVFLIGIESLFAAENGDDLRRDERLRKLYMAMTRAGQKLVLLSSRRLPEVVEALFDRPDEEGAT
jgi:superfamily I DNA/RNA helicase